MCDSVPAFKYEWVFLNKLTQMYTSQIKFVASLWSDRWWGKMLRYVIEELEELFNYYVFTILWPLCVMTLEISSTQLFDHLKK